MKKCWKSRCFFAQRIFVSINFKQGINIIWKNKSILHKSIVFLCRMCPIFQISNVTGENMDLLKMFLNLLSPRTTFKDDEPPEFQIDDTYSVPVRHILSLYFCLPLSQSFEPLVCSSGCRYRSIRDYFTWINTAERHAAPRSGSSGRLHPHCRQIHPSQAHVC